MQDDLTSYHENTWCPGCGNFALFNALKKAIRKLEERGIPRQMLAQTAGIGCHGKIFDYTMLGGIYSLHGRALATAQGIKLANPSLKVMASVGDGDCFGEGIEHLIFAAKRNAAITVLVHDNGVYALTTGQVTPVSEKGVKGPSTPQGNPEDPLNMLALMLDSGATFVARGYAGKMDHLTELIVRAVEHPGFSFLDILQPCVSFNNTYDRYNKLTEIMAPEPSTWEEGMAAAKMTQKIPLGVFYQDRQKRPYHLELQGERNPAAQRPSREQRLELIKKALAH
jgi:2-oxoglutarate ferredoxin oxidoreductase subunit beta